MYEASAPINSNVRFENKKYYKSKIKQCAVITLFNFTISYTDVAR